MSQLVEPAMGMREAVDGPFDRDRDTLTARLLWAACRPTPDPVAISEAIAHGADLELAAGTAVFQRVGPLLHRALSAAGVTGPQGPIGDLLRNDAELRRVQAAVLLPRAVAAIVDPLSAEGIEPLIFKGPTLAMRFPEPGLRPMDDIDVLVPAAVHQRALAVLFEAGWRPVERHGHYSDTYLTHPKVPGLPLELHWDLATWRERATHLRGQSLWERRVPIECFGARAFGLPTELELVALAAHAGKPYHHFHRLIWAVDIAVVVGTTPAFDWDRLAAIARAAGCRTTIAVALALAVRLGADVPDELLHLSAGRLRRRALAPLYEERWPLIECDDGLHRRLRYALWDSPSRWALLFLGEVMGGGVGPSARRAALLTKMALRRTWRLWRASRGS